MTLDTPGLVVDLIFLAGFYALWRQVRGLRDELYHGGRKEKRFWKRPKHFRGDE